LFCLFNTFSIDWVKWQCICAWAIGCDISSSSSFLLLLFFFFYFFFFFFLLNAAFAMEIPDLISVYILHHLLSGYPNRCNVPHSPPVFVLYSETIAVCSEIHTKHIHAQCGQNVELPFFKPSGTQSNHLVWKC